MLNKEHAERLAKAEQNVMTKKDERNKAALEYRKSLDALSQVQNEIIQELKEKK